MLDTCSVFETPMPGGWKILIGGKHNRGHQFTGEEFM
jgi:hypothetical protein